MRTSFGYEGKRSSLRSSINVYSRCTCRTVRSLVNACYASVLLRWGSIVSSVRTLNTLNYIEMKMDSEFIYGNLESDAAVVRRKLLCYCLPESRGDCKHHATPPGIVFVLRPSVHSRLLVGVYCSAAPWDTDRRSWTLLHCAAAAADISQMPTTPHALWSPDFDIKCIVSAPRVALLSGAWALTPFAGQYFSVLYWRNRPII